MKWKRNLILPKFRKDDKIIAKSLKGTNSPRLGHMTLIFVNKNYTLPVVLMGFELLMPPTKPIWINFSYEESLYVLQEHRTEPSQAP
jgi:hypothetical protein